MSYSTASEVLVELTPKYVVRANERETQTPLMNLVSKVGSFRRGFTFTIAITENEIEAEFENPFPATPYPFVLCVTGDGTEAVPREDIPDIEILLNRENDARSCMRALKDYTPPSLDEFLDCSIDFVFLKAIAHKAGNLVSARIHRSQIVFSIDLGMDIVLEGSISKDEMAQVLKFAS